MMDSLLTELAPRTPDTADANRLRLLAGMSAALVEKGYAATTIADIVRHARVSKRTFYEHFPDKEACFLAAYLAATDAMLAAIAGAVKPELDGREQIHHAVRAYLTVLEENPALTKSFLMEIQAAGPAALKVRRQIHHQFAELLRSLVRTARKEHSDVRPLTPPMAIAIVGGIHELVLVALEEGGPGSLRKVANTASDLIHAVLSTPQK